MSKIIDQLHQEMWDYQGEHGTEMVCVLAADLSFSWTSDGAHAEGQYLRDAMADWDAAKSKAQQGEA